MGRQHRGGEKKHGKQNQQNGFFDYPPLWGETIGRTVTSVNT
jgi:hypothetical protein